MTWNLIIEEIQYDRNPKINTIFFSNIPTIGKLLFQLRFIIILSRSYL